MSAISSSPSSEYLFQETVVSACKGALKTWVILQCHHESQKMNKAFASANSLGKVEMSTETFLKTLGLAGLQMGLAVSALQDSFRIIKNTSILGYRAFQGDNFHRSLAVATIAGGAFFLSKKN